MAKKKAEPPKKKPGIIKAYSHSLIRQAYEECLNSGARLFSFATGTPTVDGGPIDERQEILAANDLLAFAIHARRLMDNTIGQKNFGHVSIKRIPAPPTTISIVRLINVIVHHDYAEIIRRKSGFLRRPIRDSLGEFIANHKIFVKPIVTVKSDRETFFAFELAELIETFQSEILDPITDACSDDGLYLDDLFS